jgi:glycerol-3-phosphate acyltransferase PlsX
LERNSIAQEFVPAGLTPSCFSVMSSDTPQNHPPEEGVAQNPSSQSDQQKTVTIAIDAMGGDFGTSVTVPAALKALEQHTNMRLILVGDLQELQSTLSAYPQNDRLELHPASQVVSMDDLPSVALRSKRDSSMRVAINLVKEGRAQACVSAGNTGALMAIARFILKTIPGVDRPAIITSLPTRLKDKEVRVLDLGANVDSTAENLFQFAIMGSLLTKAVDKIDNPRVGLLNIGAEEMKGNEQVKEVSQHLIQSEIINYIGYVEGDAIFSGEVDVVVCDGFVGNVALKTLEGSAKLFAHYLKESYQQNFWSKLMALLSKPIFNRLKYSIDPGRRNGASLIGLRGIVIKSHGGANVAAFSHAIHEAMIEVKVNVRERIESEVAAMLVG